MVFFNADKGIKLNSLIGTIAHAGCMVNRTCYVQFNSGVCWASSWPEWVYEVAREAPLFGKSVRVFTKVPLHTVRIWWQHCSLLETLGSFSAGAQLLCFP